MVFLGSMMKTERMVNAMPLESTLVASWWSSLSTKVSDVSGCQIRVLLHVVRIGDLPLLVPNDWEAQLAARDLVNVLDPSGMAVNGVGRQANELDATLGELRLELREGAEFGGADGRVVLRVGEEYDPFVADELVEVDGAIGGLSLEVGGSAAEAEGRCALFSHRVWFCFSVCPATGMVSYLHKRREHEGWRGVHEETHQFFTRSEN
jgi:hypothetical protein